MVPIFSFISMCFCSLIHSFVQSASQSVSQSVIFIPPSFHAIPILPFLQFIPFIPFISLIPAEFKSFHFAAFHFVSFIPWISVALFCHSFHAFHSFQFMFICFSFIFSLSLHVSPCYYSCMRSFNKTIISLHFSSLHVNSVQTNLGSSKQL